MGQKRKILICIVIFIILLKLFTKEFSGLGVNGLGMAFGMTLMILFWVLVIWASVMLFNYIRY